MTIYFFVFEHLIEKLDFTLSSHPDIKILGGEHLFFYGSTSIKLRPAVPIQDQTVDERALIDWQNNTCRCIPQHERIASFGKTHELESPYHTSTATTLTTSISQTAFPSSEE